MSPFRSLFGSKKSPKTARTAASSLRLECLEDRTLLNSRFVVPIGAPIDNMTNFATLAAALTTAGLVSGDSITIRAGSAPGQVSGNQLIMPGVTNLTIQGDPALASAFVPQFQITSVANFIAAESGFTLRNVNVGLVSNGQLNFAANTNATITSSTVLAVDTTNTAINFAGTTLVLTNSSLVDNSNGGNDFVAITATNSSNLISGNDFVENGKAAAAIDYLAGSGTVTDRIVGNTIIGHTTTVNDFLFFGILSTASVSGLTIQGNTIADDGPNVGVVTTGIFVGPSATGTTIRGNVIQLTGAGMIGVVISGGSGLTSATLTNNQISTGLGPAGGTGLEIDAAANAADVVTVTGQGNDFHNNQIGVSVITSNNSAPANLMVDLGGGASSQGGNNFRGTPPAGSATGGAIVVSGTPPGTAVTIQAQNNIFGTGVTASAAVFAGGFANVSIITGGNLTGNAAFVQTAYEDFLGRLGNTSSAADAGGFVNGLNAGTATQAQVAAAVVRSSEALGVLVDGLYQRLLGRPSDAAGRAGFVNFLAGGGTVEQVIVNMVSGAEYRGLFGSDTAYIQSLYRKLLGREGSQTEVQNFLESIGAAGRAGIANAFVSSPEFRGDVVNELYSGQRATTGLMASSVFALFPDLLHRTAAAPAADVQGYVNSGRDVLSIEVLFVSGPEFFQNG